MAELMSAPQPPLPQRPLPAPGQARRLMPGRSGRRAWGAALLPIAVPLLLAGCQPRAAAPPPPAPVLQPLREARKAAEQMDAATHQREAEVRDALEGQPRTP